LQSVKIEVESFEAQMKICVLDTSGAFEMEALVRDVFPEAMFQALSNVGFAQAVNLGARVLRHEFGSPSAVLLLNPDLESANGLRDLARALTLDDTVGVAGALLVDDDGALDRGCMRRLWTRRTLFAEAVGVPALAPLLAGRSRNLTVRAHESFQLTDMVSGAFMLVRQEVFGHGLDTTLPMYLEDQEICMRAANTGLKVGVVPTARAVHSGGVSRRSLGSGRAQVVLRILELVEAPALAYALAGGSEKSARRWLGLGFRCRSILARLASPVRGPEWTEEQVLLASVANDWLRTGRRFRDGAPLHELISGGEG